MLVSYCTDWFVIKSFDRRSCFIKNKIKNNFNNTTNIILLIKKEKGSIILLSKISDILILLNLFKLLIWCHSLVKLFFSYAIIIIKIGLLWSYYYMRFLSIFFKNCISVEICYRIILVETGYFFQSFKFQKYFNDFFKILNQ